MTEQQMNCPECGGPLEAGKPCPNCLLQMVSQSTEQLDAGLDELSVLPETLANEKGKPIPLDLESVRAVFAKAQPQLEIIELIGHGGMGSVFKVRQPKLDRYVALKILSPHLAATAAFSARFAREGKLLARLSHPNIVSVYDYGQAEGLYYLILEYVEGVNLRQAMRERRFSPEQALAIVPKICDALQYAHDEGILHRDIKPENILLDTKGRVKITDFGIASVSVARWNADEASASMENPFPLDADSDEVKLTLTGQILGTPSYMAPEQMDDPNHVDHRADIYSLGVVFYELLTGELPRGRFPLPSEKTPVDGSVDEIVLKALEREREKRYQSAEELKTQIETMTGEFAALRQEVQELSNAKSPEKHATNSAAYGSWALSFLTLAVLALVLAMVLIVPQRTKLIPLERDVALAESDVNRFQKIIDENQRKFDALGENTETEMPDFNPKALALQAKRKVDDRWMRQKRDVLEKAQHASTEAKSPLNSNRTTLGIGLVCTYGSVLLVVFAFVYALKQLRRLRKMREKPGLYSSALVTCTAVPIFFVTLGYAYFLTTCVKEMFS